MPTLPSDPIFFFKTHVFFCLNVRKPGHERGCCAEKNAEAMRHYMKDRAKQLGLNRVRINQSGCLDRCELGPVIVIYPEGIWYTYSTKADIEEILQTHLIEGKRVERLMLQPEQK